MTKQELLAKAYFPYYLEIKDNIDEYGRINKDLWDKIGIDLPYENLGDGKRPITLKGFMNNNGWTKIEKDEDLPIGNQNVYFNTCLFREGEDFRVYMAQSHRTLLSDYNNGIITHYQIYQETKKPLY